jgi:type VI secretion system secreted protein VgrG
MSSVLSRQVTSALAELSGESRLYELKLRDGPDLLVEAFAADEQVQGVGMRDVIALSTRAQIDPNSLLGKSASFEASLADGSRRAASGYIVEAAKLGSNGGLARYRLRLAPWPWLLGQVRNSRVWENKSVIEIVESVFLEHAPCAQWRWSDEVRPFMAGADPRRYCCQYRESDLDFVTRLLTDEGLAWRIDGDGMVLFADSTQTTAMPEDPSSAGGGIRYHAASALEQSDSIQALWTQRQLTARLTTLVSYNYETKQVVSASVPTNLAPGGKHAPMLENYESVGPGVFSNPAQARRYAQLKMEALEARSQRWQMHSTVRTLRAGARFTLTDGPFKKANGDYVVLRLTSLGVNNLPASASAGLSELFGPIQQLLGESLGSMALDLAPDDLERMMAKALLSGYANCFQAMRAERPWRPMHPDGCLRPATASGSQSAIVVGPDGSDRPNGADEIYCDRLGRIRIRFHWQESDASCWVRVGQRSAGAGMGSQFLPRIGQEVLVKFLDNDIDRPIVAGALYNGQGEGGVAPTPGGQVDRESDVSVFERAHDHAFSAQGNLAGGNSPLWHGASGGSGGHRNKGALSGVRSKEFGGRGYNQLLFDDTDGQGRIQLKSSHAASELNLGHLIHNADNYRGSFRGLGAELRTDAYGSVRAGAGLLITSYKIGHAAASREPAGDNPAGVALLKEALNIAESFSGAAKTHETVGFAAHLGATTAGASAIDDKAAPLKAMWKAAGGMLSNRSVDAALADAEAGNIEAGDDKLPHTGAPMIAIAAKGGLGVTAGQDLQFANGETMTIMSGNDSQFISGGQLRVHSGQAIGVLAGAVKAGENNVGLQLIAAKDAIDIQAQADQLKVQARDEVNVISANAQVDWAAAKSISLSTAGGANITIAGGNITVQCPGKITIHAGMKKFDGATSIGAEMPVLPRGTMKFDEKFQLVDPAGDPIKNMRYAISKEDGGRIEGVSDDNGMIPLQQGFSTENLKIQILGIKKS